MNKEIIAKITEVDFPNRSTVEIEGKKFKFKGGLLGQVVKLYKKNRRKLIYKNVEKLSPLETEENCKYQGVCGGCTYQNFSYEDEIAYKEEMLKKLLRENDIGPEDFYLIKSPKYKEYRNKMEYTFGDEEKDGPLALGLHKKGYFHEVVDMDKCLIVHPDFDKVRIKTREYFQGTSFYNRKTHEGVLRHLSLRRTVSGEMLINLVTSSQEEIDTENYVKAMLELDLESEIKGILHTINDRMSDAVVKDELHILYGRDYVVEKLMDMEFKIGPFSFFQTNTYSAEVLYTEAEKILKEKGDYLLDLFCGTGTITSILGKNRKEALGVEIVEEAVDSARENVELNGLKNIKFIPGDVYEVVKELENKYDIIVVDPPRAGIGRKAIEKITEFGVENILYISCNPVTFVEDIKTFRECGYKEKSVHGVDQFPRTNHVETVALLSKLDVDKHINIEIELDELDLTSAESKATYAQIKEYVWNKFELKVPTLYIAQIKRKCGIELREHYNKSKKEKQIIPQCTPEKEEAIMDALRHFKMI